MGHIGCKSPRSSQFGGTCGSQGRKAKLTPQKWRRLHPSSISMTPGTMLMRIRHLEVSRNHFNGSHGEKSNDVSGYYIRAGCDPWQDLQHLPLWKSNAISSTRTEARYRSERRDSDERVARTVWMQAAPFGLWRESTLTTGSRLDLCATAKLACGK